MIHLILHKRHLFTADDAASTKFLNHLFSELVSVMQSQVVLYLYPKIGLEPFSHQLG